jgi:hypothetical protein
MRFEARKVATPTSDRFTVERARNLVVARCPQTDSARGRPGIEHGGAKVDPEKATQSFKSVCGIGDEFLITKDEEAFLREDFITPGAKKRHHAPVVVHGRPEIPELAHGAVRSERLKPAAQNDIAGVADGDHETRFGNEAGEPPCVNAVEREFVNEEPPRGRSQGVKRGCDSVKSLPPFVPEDVVMLPRSKAPKEDGEKGRPGIRFLENTDVGMRGKHPVEKGRSRAGKTDEESRLRRRCGLRPWNPEPPDELAATGHGLDRRRVIRIVVRGLERKTPQPLVNAIGGQGGLLITTEGLEGADPSARDHDRGPRGERLALEGVEKGERLPVTPFTHGELGAHETGKDMTGIALENTLDPQPRLLRTVALLEEKGVMGGGFEIQFFFEDSFVSIYSFIDSSHFLERSREIEKPPGESGIEIDQPAKPETGLAPVAPIRGRNPEGEDDLPRARESHESLAEVGFGFARSSFGHEHEPQDFENRRQGTEGFEKGPGSFLGASVISPVVECDHGAELREGAPRKHRTLSHLSPVVAPTVQRPLAPNLAATLIRGAPRSLRPALFETCGDFVPPSRQRLPAGVLRAKSVEAFEKDVHRDDVARNVATHHGVFRKDEEALALRVFAEQASQRFSLGVKGEERVLEDVPCSAIQNRPLPNALRTVHPTAVIQKIHKEDLCPERKRVVDVEIFVVDFLDQDVGHEAIAAHEPLKTALEATAKASPAIKEVHSGNGWMDERASF